MMRLAAGLFSGAVFLLPLIVTPTRTVLLIGVAGTICAALAIVTLRRRLSTLAACAFVTQQAIAVWERGGAVDVVGAIGFGLALLLMLQSMDVARCVHGATVGRGVIVAQCARWAGLAFIMVLAAGGAVPAARVLARNVPAAFAPVLAVVGALAALWIVGSVIRGAAIGRSRS